MPYMLNDLGTALHTQLYHTLMGGDETVPPPKNTFFTWCQPGIPMRSEDFDFASQGIFSTPTPDTSGTSASTPTPDTSGTSASTSTPATNGASASTKLTHAFNAAMLFDFIPDAEAAYGNNRQEGMYRPDAEAHLSTIYDQILKFSKVVHTELSAADKKKLEKFRKLMWTTKKVKNLVTDEETEVVEPGPVMATYNAKMAEYIKAVEKYNGARVAAATGDAQALAYWAFNERALRYEVKAAEDAWTSGGYRHEVDDMNAFINQVGLRDMSMWKQELLETYDRSILSDPQFGSFPVTTLVPGDFADAEGWMTLSVKSENTGWSKTNQSSDWKAGAKLAWGLWSAGPSASGSKTEMGEDHEVKSFGLSLRFAQVMIVRPWFYPEWFANRGWMLRKGEGWMYDDVPSDGATPPHGKLIGYPTMVLFAKDIEITSADLVSAYDKAESSREAGAQVGWGPFKLSGAYHRSSGNETFSSKADGATLKVPGMQIIGFVNHLIGKAPNPLPELKEADFQ